MRHIIPVACLALALSAPAFAAPTPAPIPPKIDPQAMALLQRSARSMFALKSYQAECDTTLSYPAQDGKPARARREHSILKAVKPNRMWYVQQTLKQDIKTGKWTPDTKDFGITFVCDGKTNWKQFGANYRTDHNTDPDQLGTILEPWGGFYSAHGSPQSWVDDNQKAGGLVEISLAGHESIDGTPCDKVFDHLVTSFNGEKMEYWETWYIADDGLVRHHVQRLEFDGKPGFTRDATIHHIILDKPISTRIFAYAPPKGVKSEVERTAEEPKLLPTGQAAPDFTATNQDGQSVKLSDYEGKVVVIDFWASWCPPCRASMPHNQEVTKKLQAEGLPVVLLAVDNSEDRDAFLKWVTANGPALSALTFAHVPPATDVAGKLYHVSGIPTQYVIDTKGNVSASFVGYGGPTGDLETAVRAALKTP